MQKNFDINKLLTHQFVVAGKSGRVKIKVLEVYFGIKLRESSGQCFHWSTQQQRYLVLKYTWCSVIKVNPLQNRLKSIYRFIKAFYYVLRGAFVAILSNKVNFIS